MELVRGRWKDLSIQNNPAPHTEEHGHSKNSELIMCSHLVGQVTLGGNGNLSQATSALFHIRHSPNMLVVIG
jgi:hypothetical protein